jgi:hypothetical protein
LRIRVHQLGEVHALGVDELQSFTQKLVVSAVGAVDRISWAKRHGRTDGATFLTDARVSWAVNESFAGKFENGFFEGAHEVHLTEQVREQLGVGGLVVSVGRFELDPGRSGLKWRNAGHVVRS